jgi:hypothetical protein
LIVSGLFLSCLDTPLRKSAIARRSRAGSIISPSQPTHRIHGSAVKTDAAVRNALCHGSTPSWDSSGMAQDAPAIKVNCPDCSGVISLDVSDTGHRHYVCQIGHAYSVEELSIAKEDQVENGFWSLIGLLEHLEEVDRHLLMEAERAHRSVFTEALHARLKESQHQREILRQLIEQTHRPLISDRRPDTVGEDV